MKALTVLLVLSAFATVFANQLVFHKAFYNLLEGDHQNRMAKAARDYNLPLNPLISNDASDANDAKDLYEPWMKPCVHQGIRCFIKSGKDACQKLCCGDQFFECLQYHKPEGHPGLLAKLTPLQKGCLALVGMCRAYSPSCEGKLCCYLRFQKCFEFVSQHER